jgi:hypothetical protein
MITSVNQISGLPWSGSMVRDEPLARMVDKFIQASTDRETQRYSLELLFSYFVGEEGSVSDSELDLYLSILENLHPRPTAQVLPFKSRSKDLESVNLPKSI